MISPSQVSEWNHVVDSHLRLRHRLDSLFTAHDADRIVNDAALSTERRLLIQLLSEYCDFLRGVRVPRSTVLAHMRGSTKSLPPSVKLIARLLQLLLSPWLSLPCASSDKRSGRSSKKEVGGNAFFENISALLKDVPKTSSFIIAAHRSFASTRRFLYRVTQR